MAIAFGVAQNSTSGSASSRNVTLASVPDDAIVVVTTRQPSGQTVTVTDDFANTYSQVVDITNPGDVRNTLWVATNVGTHTLVVTASFSGTGACGIVGSYFTGVDTAAGAVDSGSALVDSATGVAVNIGSQTGPGLIVTGIAASSATWTAPSGYTIPANGSNTRTAFAYQIIATTGTYDPDWQFSSSSVAASAMAFLEDGGGGGGGAVKKMLLLGCG